MTKEQEIEFNEKIRDIYLVLKTLAETIGSNQKAITSIQELIIECGKFDDKKGKMKAKAMGSLLIKSQIK